MMDIWLIFNLLLPFLEVLMHTYMDTLRAEEEREVNHHGQTRMIGWEDIEDDVDIKAKSQKNKIIQVRVCARACAKFTYIAFIVPGNPSCGGQPGAGECERGDPTAGAGGVLRPQGGADEGASQ